MTETYAAAAREALQDCLARIEAGVAPADALAACPDPELRAIVAPLIVPALGLREVPAIPAERGQVIRASLDHLAAELYPAGSPHPVEAPPAPRAPDHPGDSPPIRLVTIAAIGVGLALVAWSTTRNVRPERQSDAARLSTPIDPRAATVRERFPPTLAVPPAEPLRPPLAQPPVEPLPDGRGSDTAWGLVNNDDEGLPCSDMLGVEREGDAARSESVSAPGRATSQVAGRVVAADCRPIADAIVILTTTDGTSEFLARTEVDGTFVLAVPPDLYRAEILADGYTLRGWYDGHAYRETAPADLRVEDAGSSTDLDFVLSGSPTGGSR